MLVPPEFLVHALKPWADFYGHSRIAPTVVTFLHVGAVVVAGGFAMSTDSDTFRSSRGSKAAQARHLDDMTSVHAWIVGGLVVSVVSGLLLFAADLKSFYGSVVFWSKMVFLLALLANGFVMIRATHALRDGTADATAWRTLRATSVVSITLWFTISLFGILLVYM